jgi:hypothetical protein
MINLNGNIAHKYIFLLGPKSAKQYLCIEGYAGFKNCQNEVTGLYATYSLADACPPPQHFFSAFCQSFLKKF